MGCADRDAPRKTLSKPAAFVVLSKGLDLRNEPLTVEEIELLHRIAIEAMKANPVPRIPRPSFEDFKQCAINAYAQAYAMIDESRRRSKPSDDWVVIDKSKTQTHVVLTMRVANFLLMEGYRYMEDLQSLTDSQLEMIAGIGPKSLQEIRAWKKAK